MTTFATDTPWPPIAAVPLRASAVRIVTTRHEAHARDLRALADDNESRARSESDAWWRQTLLDSARGNRIAAEEHELAAAVWAGRVRA